MSVDTLVGHQPVPVAESPADPDAHAAFVALYEQHARGLYDFAARMLGDREAAADIVQIAFAKGWAAIGAGTTIGNVKAWLYTVAHNAAIDELRHRKRQVPSEADDPALSVVDPDPVSSPEDALRDKELAELVWSCASALSPQDYALLDLHVRRGLDADELAGVLGLRKGAVYTRLSRLRSSFEDSVAATVLMRRGRRECPELDALLTGLAGKPARAVHRAVNRHVDTCARCEESKRRLVSPVEILGGLTPIPLAPGLHRPVLPGLTRRSTPAEDRPRAHTSRRTLRWRLVLAAAAAVLLIGTAAAVGAATLLPPSTGRAAAPVPQLVHRGPLAIPRPAAPQPAVYRPFVRPEPRPVPAAHPQPVARPVPGPVPRFVPPTVSSIPRPEPIPPSAPDVVVPRKPAPRPVPSPQRETPPRQESPANEPPTETPVPPSDWPPTPPPQTPPTPPPNQPPANEPPPPPTQAPPPPPPNQPPPNQPPPNQPPPNQPPPNQPPPNQPPPHQPPIPPPPGP